MLFSSLLVFALGAFSVVNSLPTTALQERGNTSVVRVTRDLNENVKKIGKSFELLKSFNDAIGKDGFNIFKDALGVALKASKFLAMIGPALGPIGTIFSIAAVFIPKGPSPELKAIEKGFKEMHNRFDAVDRKLDNIFEAVVTVQVYAEYRVQQTKLKNIKAKYSDAMGNPGASSLDDLKGICRSDDPDLVLNWIHEKINKNADAFGGDLTKTIFNDVKYNRTLFSEYADVIVGDALEAARLNQICMGVKFPGDEGKVQYEKTEAEKMIREIVNKLKMLDEKIRTDFKIDQNKKKDERNDQLERDIISELKNAKDKMDNVAFAPHLYQVLESKYDWLDWMVIAYDPVGDFKNHAVDGPNYRYNFREYGRNVVVAYTEKVDKKKLIKDGQKKLIKTAPSIGCLHHHAENIRKRLLDDDVFYGASTIFVVQQSAHPAFAPNKMWFGQMCGFDLFVAYWD